MLRYVAGRGERGAGRPGGSGGPVEPGSTSRRDEEGWTEIQPGVYGYGDPDPTTGLYRFIDARERFGATTSSDLTWSIILDHWDLIENDLADRGIDVGDDALMSARSWRWLRTRILGLLSAPASFEPWSGKTLPANRLQAALVPSLEESREAK